MGLKPTMTRRQLKRRAKNLPAAGEPKWSVGEHVGEFTIVFYMGHSDVNKRNNRIMSKPQHWYRVKCKCGTNERRSQQELTDTRRALKCVQCREEEYYENQLKSKRDRASTDRVRGESGSPVKWENCDSTCDCWTWTKRT